MIYLLLFAALLIFLIVVFENRHFKTGFFSETNKERFLLSVIFAIAIQALFIPMIPGWIIAAMIVGKNYSAETQFSNELFGFLMMSANTIIYLPLFYSLLGLSSKYRKDTGEVFLSLNTK